MNTFWGMDHIFMRTKRDITDKCITQAATQGKQKSYFQIKWIIINALVT